MINIWITGSSRPQSLARLHRQYPRRPVNSRVQWQLDRYWQSTHQVKIPNIGVHTDVSIYFLSAARGYTMTRRGLRSCVTADFRDAHRGRSVTRAMAPGNQPPTTSRALYAFGGSGGTMFGETNHQGIRDEPSQGLPMAPKNIRPLPWWVEV